MKLAINGQQLAATHTLPQLLDVLDRFGVKAVEFWPANLPGGGTEEENERYETRDVAAAAKLLRDRGFEVACVTLGFWAAPVCVARGGIAALTEAFRGTVDAAVTLRARLVNCYTAGLPLSIFRKAVEPAAKYAAERGVVITLENEAHDDTAFPQAIASLVQAIDSPGFGTQYDPCNYYHGGVEPYPAAYNAIRSHIRYVHLKGGAHYDPQNPNLHQGSTMRGTDRDFIGYLPLPDAAFPIEAIVRSLKRDGYRGYVTLEPHVKSEHVLEFYDIEIPYLSRLLNS